MTKPLDDADRAKAGTLPSDPSDDTVKAAIQLRAVRPDERRTSDEPCDLPAERALLGALLWAASNQPDVLRVSAVRDILGSGESFYSRRAGDVFDAIMACSDSKQEHDPVAVHSQRLQRGQSSNLDDLLTLVNEASTVSERQARVYAQSIRDTWARRCVIRDARVLIDDARKAKTPASELLARAQAVAKTFAEKSSTTAGVVSIKESAIAFFEMVQSGSNPAITTGFHDIDKVMNGGFRPGDVTILAARTNVGKSALSAAIAENMTRLRPDIGVLYVTLEMQHVNFTARLVSSAAGVPLSSIRKCELSPAQMQDVGLALQQLSGRALYFADNPTQTLAAIYASALDCQRRLARDGKRLGLVVVDHMGLVKPSAESLKRANREQQVAETSRAQRYIAQELGCHVLGLAQIGRAAEKDGVERMPKLHHLRESGAIEQDADSVLILHRERDVKTGAFKTDKPPALALAKGRMDETRVFLLGWHPERARFGDWMGNETYADVYGV